MIAAAIPAYAKMTRSDKALDPNHAASMAPVFRKLIRGASKLAALEALFPAKWNAEARRMLPSANPQLPSTALWGPVLAWCVLQVLAEAVDAENSELMAVELFDRLRLREPMAQAFHALGLEGENGWRAAARLKALLLLQCETCQAPSALKAQSALTDKARGGKAASVDALIVPERLWGDPDVCWLTGAHLSGEHTYLVREKYEELLWWTQLPELFRLATAPAPHRSQVLEVARKIENALATLESSGYRLDAILEPELTQETEPLEGIVTTPHSENAPPVKKEVLETVPGSGHAHDAESDSPEPEDLKAEEPVSFRPVGPIDPDGPPEEY
jgi:hypothetical protein